MTKILYLMQGIPGSGKSTVAESLKQSISSGGAYPELIEIFSTDNFFYDAQWNYNFNPDHLGIAHRTNQIKAENAMRHGTSNIIIDNTNIKREHVQPYVEAANRYGYDIQVVRVSVSVEVAIKRNADRPDDRRVPEDTIRRMALQMESLL